MKNILLDLFSQENNFFQLTKNAKRITHISLSSFIVPIIFLVIAGILAQFILAPLIFNSSLKTAAWINEVYTLLTVFGFLIVLIFLWIRFFEGRPIFTLGFTKEGALKKYLSGFAFGILINTIVIGTMALLGGIEIANESANLTGIDSIWIVFIFLLGFIVQGASEEILSRGWMLQVIGTRYKPWLGVLISTVFFTIIHLGNSGVNPASVINLLLVAFLLCLFVLNEGSLWFACAWHSSWNWMLGNVYGLSVSGSGEKVSIFDLNTTGNELISGGGFGPEGSLVTTFVLVVVIFVFAQKIRRKQIN